VGPDNFSARWTGSFNFATAGDYTFTAVSDDGIRVWVDGALLIDQWRDQAPTTFTASRTLTAGQHDVKVEWFETGGGAVAKLSWAAGAPDGGGTPGGGGTGACPAEQYRAEYFANRTLSGTPASTGCEAAPLDRNWGSGGPAGVGSNNFSARWTGSFRLSGTVTFTATGDDGIRVWLNGSPLIDRWSSAGSSSVTRTLADGVYEVKVEHFENKGTALARLLWRTG
jgi:hypothetical protein